MYKYLPYMLMFFCTLTASRLLASSQTITFAVGDYLAVPYIVTRGWHLILSITDG